MKNSLNASMQDYGHVESRAGSPGRRPALRQATVYKSKDGLGVRTPQELARQIKLAKGTKVLLSAKLGQIVIMPIIGRQIPLKSLVARITPKNLHAQTDWGAPQGKEIW